jgi:putative glutamine amidotransferase
MPTPLPIIAVSATSVVVDDRARVRLNQSYVDALQRAGAVPLVVPPLDPDAADALISRVDGLLLSGGDDVDPRLYGEEPHPRTDPPNAACDRSEISLVRAARVRRLPTLAICRGVQLVNVAFGGTLIQDIPSQVTQALAHDRPSERAARVHAVGFDPASTLRRVIGDNRITANSMHHQAVDRPGEGLRVCARADDGLVEALEWSDDDWWMLGVQWHPEELDQTPEDWDRSLFAGFLAAVSSSAATGPRRAPGA